MQLMHEQIQKGDFKKALLICKEFSTPFASVAQAGLNSIHLDEKEISEAMEREIVIEIYGEHVLYGCEVPPY